MRKARFLSKYAFNNIHYPIFKFFEMQIYGYESREVKLISVQ